VALRNRFWLVSPEGAAWLPAAVWAVLVGFLDVVEPTALDEVAPPTL